MDAQLPQDASMLVMYAPTPVTWVISQDARVLWLLRERHLFSVTLEPSPPTIRSFPLLPGRLIAGEEVGAGAHTHNGWQRATRWTFTDPELPELRLEVHGVVTLSQQGATTIDAREAFARTVAEQAGWNFADNTTVLPI
jgi:hypothetical protein